MTGRPNGRRNGGVSVLLVALLIVPATAGCLDDEEKVDVTGWDLALGLGRFDTNGMFSVNVTELKFSIRFGAIHEDPWYLQESRGFTLADEGTFPVRLEARYDDGSGPPEAFPIIGSSHLLTGVLRVEGIELTLSLDGDPSLYTIEGSHGSSPNQYETSADVTGDYGTLEMFFTLSKP